MIFDVIPMMDRMILQLKDVVAQKHAKLHAITILAAQAALNVALKYQQLSEECELYDMSIGESCIPHPNCLVIRARLVLTSRSIALCPDKKVAYFSSRSTEAQANLRARLLQRFEEFTPTGYFPGGTHSVTPQSRESSPLSQHGSTESALRSLVRLCNLGHSETDR